MSPFARFIYFIKERDRIRIRKLANLPQAQWTNDPILKKWRFCNVDRNEDTQTKWIHNHIIRQHHKDSNLWLNLVLARFINWSPTLINVGYIDIWAKNRFVECMKSLCVDGGKVWTGAYMVKSDLGVPKYEYVARIVQAMVTDHGKENAIELTTRCSDTAKWMLGFTGMGEFMVNQIVTDMKYSRYLKDAVDWSTFVLPGPGTRRGLNRVLYNDKNKPLRTEVAVALMQDVRKEVRLAIPQLKTVFRDLNNISNCLCEFDKYERVRLSEGQPRAKYTPASPA